MRALAAHPETDGVGLPTPWSAPCTIESFLKSVLHVPYNVRLVTASDLRLAAAELGKHPTLLMHLRPHVPGDVPWHPHALYSEGDLSCLIASHGCYIVLVYRLYVLQRIIDGTDTPKAVRTAAVRWRGAHVPLMLYITTEAVATHGDAGYSDEVLLSRDAKLCDCPADKYAPSCQGVFTAGNSLPRLYRELNDNCRYVHVRHRNQSPFDTHL